MSKEEQIEDLRRTFAHGHEKKLAIHQIPPIMKFMAEDMLGVDG